MRECRDCARKENGREGSRYEGGERQWEYL